MVKETGEMWKAFIQSGVIGKFFIIVLIMISLIIGIVIWSNIQDNKMLVELIKQNNNVEQLIENQVKIDIFKKCIKVAHDKATDTLNNEFLIILGNTMQQYKVPFPQELNKAIQKFRVELNKVKDCLIFPEEL